MYAFRSRVIRVVIHTDNKAPYNSNNNKNNNKYDSVYTVALLSRTYKYKGLQYIYTYI